MANGDTKTEAMLNVLGNGGTGDEFRGCCNTKTQQYILDAIDRINNIQPGGGDGAEYVNLTVTNVGSGSITVTPDKTPTEVKALVDAGKEVIYRLVVTQTVGTFSAGTYLLQTIWASDGVVAASAVAGDNSSVLSYVFAQVAGTNSGTIYIKNLGSGGGPTVVQTTGTSTTDVMSQNATTKMIFRGGDTKKIGIGDVGSSNQNYTVSIGSGSIGKAIGCNAIGYEAIAGNNNSDYRAIAIGTSAHAYAGGAIALGAGSTATNVGEMNIGTSNTTDGYNSSNYRLLSGLYDGQSAHDAATVGQAVGTTESYTIASASWTALSASSPYTYSTTVTATYTIGNDTIAELINDNAVAFSNYGFSIGSISGQSLTIYSIGQPSASVTLKVNYKG